MKAVKLLEQPSEGLILVAERSVHSRQFRAQEGRPAGSRAVLSSQAAPLPSDVQVPELLIVSTPDRVVKLRIAWHRQRCQLRLQALDTV